MVLKTLRDEVSLRGTCIGKFAVGVNSGRAGGVGGEGEGEGSGRETTLKPSRVLAGEKREGRLGEVKAAVLRVGGGVGGVLNEGEIGGGASHV